MRVLQIIYAAAVVEKKMEHKGEQGVQALVEPWSDASVGTAAVGRKACLRTKQNNVEQCKNQAHTES